MRFERWIVQARGEEGQYWPELLRVVNWWTRVRVDELVRVSAGELADGSRRGVAVVSRTTSSIPLEMIANPRDWRSVVLLQTPNPTGAFRIKSAADDTITLVAENDSQWLLDLLGARPALSRAHG